MKSVLPVRLAAIGVCIALLLCSAAAFAQNRAGAVTVNPFVGRMLFDHDLDYDNDTIFGLGLGYSLTADFAAELSFSRVNTTMGASSDNADVDLYRLEGLYYLSKLLPGSRLVPHLAAGVGMMSFERSPSGSGRDNDLAADYGIGLNYFINPDVALRADVRHVLNFRGEGDTVNSNLLYAFGLSLLLGGKEKAAAAAPVAVPEKPAPQAAAPAPVDSDGDGVIDSLDKCPDTPKGTKVDASGCPLPEKAEVTKRGTYSFGIVYFDTNKATIKPKSKPVLDEAVAYMKNNPGVKLEVQGYTDSTGPEAYNLKLSDARANTVRNYMIDKGIPADRLTAKGYGESNPAASNATKEGRAENRRIEFKSIQ